MIKHLQRLAKRYGYVLETTMRRDERLQRMVNLQNKLIACQKEKDEIKDMHWNDLLPVMQQARMVIARYEMPDDILVSYDFADIERMMPGVSYRRPVDEQWYVLNVWVDVGMLQRIHEDLWNMGRSHELDYFLDMFTDKLMRHLKAVMRLENRS